MRQHKTFRQLYAAQVIALLGTGLASVALSLLAFELVSEEAGKVLGTVLAIKMMAYVIVAPVANAFLQSCPRKVVLMVLDGVRASVAFALPFVTAVWQVYVLIAIIQIASAAFTPLFQATIPETLPDEASYTKALSLSRIAYDLESILSPGLAGLLLIVMHWQGLFYGTLIGFLASALLILPLNLTLKPVQLANQSAFVRIIAGIRLYLSSATLRWIMPFNMIVSLVGAFIIVNTVVWVQNDLGLAAKMTAWALLAFGSGSLIASLLLPKLLEYVHEKKLMTLFAIIAICLLLIVGAIFNRLNFSGLMSVWCLLGLCFASMQLPMARIINRFATVNNRSSLFAAQFSLSHACWLVAYPLAGWLGYFAGLQITLVLFAILGLFFVRLSHRLRG